MHAPFLVRLGGAVGVGGEVADLGEALGGVVSGEFLLLAGVDLDEGGVGGVIGAVVGVAVALFVVLGPVAVPGEAGGQGVGYEGEE